MLKLALTFIFLLQLGGCASGPVSRPEPEVNTLQTTSLAETAYAASDWQASEKYYSMLISSGTQQALHWYRLGNIYAFTNRPEAAVVAYREAIRLQPDLAVAWYNLGMIQLKQASYSLGQLQLHAGEDLQTAEKGKKILQGILEIIGTHGSE